MNVYWMKAPVISLALSWCHMLTYTYILLLYVPLDCLSVSYWTYFNSCCLFWYLAAINPTCQHLLTLCLPSYSVYVFHITYSHLWILYNNSSPLLAICISQFLSYLHILFYYLLSMILRISQPISKALICLLTVQ